MTRRKSFLILMALWFLAIVAYIIYGEYKLNAGEMIDIRIIVHKEKPLFKDEKTFFSYEINEIRDEQKIFNKNLQEIKKTSLKNGQVIYASLIKDGNYFKTDALYLSPPKDLLFIRGKVETSGILFNMLFTSYSIIYGLENFDFLQENLAIISTKSEISAEVKVNFYGTPSLISLSVDGNKFILKEQNEKNN